MTDINATRLRVAVACRRDIRELYLQESELARLRRIADVRIGEFDVASDPWAQVPENADDERRLSDFVGDADVLVLCHGAPRVTQRVFEACPGLRVVGDIEGDRFAGRIDVPAARRAGVMVIDTTHASSWPVAEWALALSIIGLRDHARFREIIAGENMSMAEYRTRPPGRELTGKRVGLIGFGHIAWRLRELLGPFRTPIVAYDPYAPRELADAMGIDFAPLDLVMACDVVVCLAPATPATAGMVGAHELELLRPGAVFVNVSRGTVVDVPALLDRAERGDAWFALDAHDPEPIAVESPLRGMRNVFLSPHVAGVTAEAQPRFFALMVDELERFRSGREPRAQLTDRVIAGRGVAEPVSRAGEGGAG